MSSSNKTEQELDLLFNEGKERTKDIIRTDDVASRRNLSFSDFHLKTELLQGLFTNDFLTPTPVQEETIPVALTGQNILARAKNGTGKTASYLVPILNQIDVTLPYVQALVLVPTRELAIQTSDVCSKIGKFLKPEVMVCIGGTKVADDILRLKQTVHIIVATFGRLNDLCNRNLCDLSKCSIVALDEADKLLAEDSIGSVEEILRYCSPKKQIMLFSATFTKSVETFLEKFVPDVHPVNVMEELILKGVTQFYCFVQERQKLQCLTTLISMLEINQCIIFCNSVNRVELLAKKILELKLPCLYAHSRMDQEKRNKVFHDFRSHSVRFLVATDLFTRGIDNQSVNVVINFDTPNRSEVYLNRIGRSGRSGQFGIAISLITQNDRKNITMIEQELSTELKPLPKEVDKSLY